MLLRSSLASAAMLTLTVSASAQLIPLMPFSQTIGTYVPLTGGTVLGTVTGTGGAASLDDISFPVTLPFAFPFNGSTYTALQVQSNGHIAFGTLGTTTYTPLSSTIANAGYVSACGRDLQGGFTFVGSRTTGSDLITGVSSLGPIQVGDLLSGTGIPTGATVVAIVGSDIQMSAPATSTSSTATISAFGPWSEMRWEVQGSAPNQVFIAQWSNFKRFGSTATTTQHTNLNFQIHLHENGDIQCVYGACDPGLTTTTAAHQVGLRGPTNVFATDVNNRANVKGVNDDWSLSAAGTVNTSNMLFNNTAPANVIPNGLTYTWNPASGTLASNTTVGSGCGGVYNSVYEQFANAAVASAALQGNAIQFAPSGSGYSGSWLPGIAGALFVTPVTPTTLTTGDDGTVVVTPTIPLTTPFGPQTSLVVSGNAIIGFGSGLMDYPGTNSYTPTPGGFLNSTLGGFYSWHDYNEVEGGDVLSEEIGGVLYITYNNVESYPGTPTVNPSTLQFQLDLASGIVTIVWVSIDTDITSTFGSGHLVGVTAPGASLNPGSVNLATATLLTSSPENAALSLAASNRPVQGAGPQLWNLQADNLPAGLGIGVEIFGLADPGVLDLSLFGLGLPGCQLRATLDSLNGFVTAGGSHAYALTIPGGAPSLVGVEISTQVAYFAASLADTRTTNGIKGLIGDL